MFLKRLSITLLFLMTATAQGMMHSLSRRFAQAISHTMRPAAHRLTRQSSSLSHSPRRAAQSQKSFYDHLIKSSYVQRCAGLFLGLGAGAALYAQQSIHAQGNAHGGDQKKAVELFNPDKLCALVEFYDSVHAKSAQEKEKVCQEVRVLLANADNDIHFKNDLVRFLVQKMSTKYSSYPWRNIVQMMIREDDKELFSRSLIEAASDLDFLNTEVLSWMSGIMNAAQGKYYAIFVNEYGGQFEHRVQGKKRDTIAAFIAQKCVHKVAKDFLILQERWSPFIISLFDCPESDLLFVALKHHASRVMNMHHSILKKAFAKKPEAAAWFIEPIVANIASIKSDVFKAIVEHVPHAASDFAQAMLKVGLHTIQPAVIGVLIDHHPVFAKDCVSMVVNRLVQSMYVDGYDMPLFDLMQKIMAKDENSVHMLATALVQKDLKHVHSTVIKAVLDRDPRMAMQFAEKIGGNPIGISHKVLALVIKHHPETARQCARTLLLTTDLRQIDPCTIKAVLSGAHHGECRELQQLAHRAAKELLYGNIAALQDHRRSSMEIAGLSGQGALLSALTRCDQCKDAHEVITSMMPYLKKPLAKPASERTLSDLHAVHNAGVIASNSSLDGFIEKKELADLKEAFDVQAERDEQAGYTVVVHGQRKSHIPILDINMDLWALRNNCERPKDFLMVRVRKAMSAQEELKMRDKMMGKYGFAERDVNFGGSLVRQPDQPTNAELAQYSFFVDLTFFGCANFNGSCAASFLAHDVSETEASDLEMETVFAVNGIPEEIYQKYAEQLQRYQSMIQKISPHGNMLMVSIPNDKTVDYLSEVARYNKEKGHSKGEARVDDVYRADYRRSPDDRVELVIPATHDKGGLLDPHGGFKVRMLNPGNTSTDPEKQKAWADAQAFKQKIVDAIRVDYQQWQATHSPGARARADHAS